MKVKFKKLHPNAVIPTFAHENDAGADLTAISAEYDHKTIIQTLGTGLAVEIPKGYVGLIFPRSSVYKKQSLLTNSVGVIDSGFIGEIKFKFYTTFESNKYKIGDKVGQLIIMPIPKIEFEEVSELFATERGEGGFGSTDV